MNNHKTYECINCNKIYNSYMGYWKQLFLNLKI